MTIYSLFGYISFNTVVVLYKSMLNSIPLIVYNIILILVTIDTHLY